MQTHIFKIISVHLSLVKETHTLLADCFEICLAVTKIYALHETFFAMLIY